MLKQTLLVMTVLASAGVNAQAADVPIMGNIASKCVITTDTPGVFGNPAKNILSTAPTDGGVLPIVRYDIVEADAYKAQIAWPRQFSTSPVLNDVVNWTGDVELLEVSDANMADFEVNKIQFDNVTEYDLTLAGSVWFQISSKADYGFNKSFPGGQYRAGVVAECIAK